MTNEVKDDLQLHSSEVADDFPVEVGVTKESMIEYDESERQRSINKITDQIRERTPLAAGETGTVLLKLLLFRIVTIAHSLLELMLQIVQDCSWTSRRACFVSIYRCDTLRQKFWANDPSRFGAASAWS